MLALALPCCGDSSPAAATSAAMPSLQGRYLLSVRPGALCSGFPASLLEVEVQATAAAGRVSFGGANASGSFEAEPAAGSGLAGRLEIFASNVVLPRGVADAGIGSFYVFAQATGGVTSAAGRDEVRNGELTGSVTLFRVLAGVSHTDRCSVPGHSWSLVAR